MGRSSHQDGRPVIHTMQSTLSVENQTLMLSDVSITQTTLQWCSEYHVSCYSSTSLYSVQFNILKICFCQYTTHNHNDIKLATQTYCSQLMCVLAHFDRLPHAFTYRSSLLYISNCDDSSDEDDCGSDSGSSGREFYIAIIDTTVYVTNR